MKRNEPLLWGAVASILMLLLYALVLTAANSVEHLLEETARLWPWLLALSAGFGLQVGLYRYLKVRHLSGGSRAGVAAAGGVSTGSMIACCAHHLVDVLPFLGLSATAVFLSKYQIPFLVLGVVSNLVGVTIMLAAIQHAGLGFTSGAFGRLFLIDMRKLRTGAAAVAVLAVSAAFALTGTGRVSAAPAPAPALTSGAAAGAAGGAAEDAEPAIVLSRQVDERNAVAVAVEPVDFRFGDPIEFRISLNTHQGDLGFELDEISTLTDDLGNRYQPFGWSGSAPGGHHRSGELVFPPLEEGAKEMKLVLRNIYGIPEREFVWKVR